VEGNDTYEREGVDLKNSTRIAVVLGVAALGMLVTASSAFALHARPKGASPLTFKLVPAFEACPGTTPINGLHGAPLALPSCNPPTQLSSELTLRAPERVAPYFGAADGTGQIILKVTCVSSISPPVENGDVPPCNANVGDQEDVKISTTSTGIRCVGDPTGVGQQLCAGGVGAAGAGSLYNGKVLGSSTIRITDHYNALSPNPPGTDCSDTTSCTATVADLPFDVGAQCTGGNCGYITSADAVVTNTVQEQKRAVVELGQINIQDAGEDGNLSPGIPPTTGICPPACSEDDPSNVAFVQGLFLP